jgi:predicted metal-binding protein
MMDRDSALEPSELTVVEPAPAQALTSHAPSAPVVVSVCTTCKSADGDVVVGPDMFAAIKSALGGNEDAVMVRPVQCLSVCKRPATVAVTSPDGYSFLFGDLQTESGTAALVAFVQSYRKSDYGLVPWRERADVLRKGMVARVPPLRWSPDDGRAPK